MENILKAAENFQVAPIDETINESLFLEFMNKVAIWDYFGISKVHYLTLSESEKPDKITKYYVNVKSRNNTGKVYIFLFFIFFFILKMNPRLTGCLLSRDSLSDMNKVLTSGFFRIVIIVRIVASVQLTLSFKKS